MAKVDDKISSVTDGSESEIVKQFIERYHENRADVCREYAEKELDTSLWGTRNFDEDFHKYRTESSRRAMNLLDDRALDIKKKYTIQSLGIPQNKDLLDFLKFAKYLNVEFLLDPKPLGPMFVIKYVPDIYNNEMKAWFGEWTSLSLDESPVYYSSYVSSEDGPPSLLSLNSNLRNEIYDLNYKSESNNSISIHQVATFVQAEVDRAVITVVNLITGKVIFKKEITDKNFDRAELLKEITAVVSKENFMADIEKLPAATAEDIERWGRTWAFRPLSYSEEPASSPEVVFHEWHNAIFKNAISFTISGPHNRADSSDGFDTSISFLLNSMEEIDYSPVGIRPGRLKIEIRKNIGNKEGLDDDVLEDEGFRDTGENWVKYVEAHYADSQDDPVFRPVVIDMRPLDSGVLQRSFYQASFMPLYKVGDYNIYFDERIDEPENFAEKLKRAAMGTRQAEDFIGGGRLIKGIHVVDTLSANMTVSSVNPDIFFVYDEMSAYPEAMSVFARHETFHSADYKYHLSEDRAFGKLFDEIDCVHPDFFNFINESYSYELPLGGHAQENVRELFATLVNSTLSLLIFEKLRDTSPLNRKYYYDSLVVLKEILEDELPDDIPVIKRVGEIIDWMLSASSLWDKIRD